MGLMVRVSRSYNQGPMLKRWMKWVSPLVTLVIAGTIYLSMEHGVSAPPFDPQPIPSDTGVPAGQTGTRSSEHFQIADDAVGGDVSALGDLSPTEAAANAGSTGDATSTGQEPPAPKVVTNATVQRVIDGDTLVARFDHGETATIRMLGVNTPETVDPRKPVQCFGKEASNFTKSALDGKLIRLDPDPQADERDKYGRLLRNITLEDGTDYNAELVQQGYAQAYLSFPLDPVRKKQLSDLQKEAKDAERGMWAPGVCTK
jgi:micrococcal nuclease